MEALSGLDIVVLSNLLEDEDDTKRDTHFVKEMGVELSAGVAYEGDVVKSLILSV